MRVITLLGCATVAAAASDAVRAALDTLPRPLLIAHRGLAQQYPEHTVEAHRAAIDAGADFIEMDVVSTSDHVLIVRHSMWLEQGTNIASVPAFADRRRTYDIPFDGKNVTDTAWLKKTATDTFYAKDFTLQEVKQLEARHTYSFRDQRYTGLKVATLDEILEMASTHVSKKTGRKVRGIYIETKLSEFHIHWGLPLERKMIDSLTKWGFGKADNTMVESFEGSSLLLFKEMGFDVPRVFLVDCCNPINLNDTDDAALDKYQNEYHADAVGVWKAHLRGFSNREAAPCCEDAVTGSSTQYCYGRFREAGYHSDFVRRAHGRGLTVHTFTFRNEMNFLMIDYYADPAAELDYYLDSGENAPDGIFFDNVATGVRWRDAARARANAEQCDSNDKVERHVVIWIAAGVFVATLFLAGCCMVCVTKCMSPSSKSLSGDDASQPITA
eukprot:Hpha_TRINITY_DN4369_c0_g1::TRINITY_DN4369_c0_g1_i1::g.50026::m.50026/K01126/E3.1.4.46, glpQ, ugpQ; glycerophosphoryl diester phosphodiesterase